MKLRLPSLPAFLTFFFFLSMLVKLAVKSSKTRKLAKNLPPGPWPLPFIGNVHQLLGRVTHRALRDLSMKYGPLIHLKLGEVPTIVVSSPDTVKQILKTHDMIFFQRPYILAHEILSYNRSNIIIAPYGNYWRQMRKICTIELLSAKRVQSFRSIREEEVSNLVKDISFSSSDSELGLPINLTEKIFSLIYGITSRAAFGNKCKDQEAFITIIKQVVKVAGGFCFADMYPSSQVLKFISGMRHKLEKLHRATDEILGNIVNEHKKARNYGAIKSSSGEQGDQEDLVDVLVKLQEHGDLEFPLSDDNIKAVILDIFAAGSESSATAIEWAMLELLKNPKLMKYAQTEVRQVFDAKGGYVDEEGISELKFLKLIIKETLRLHPSAPLSGRECDKDCVIDGYEIPAKTKVILNMWAVGRDPKYWKEAENFDPWRFSDNPIDFKGTNFEYIPFGAGRRICPGISFALPNIELPLAKLLYHFDWKLPNGMKHEDLDMTESIGLTVKCKNDLFLIPISYRPLNLG
ncbi:hypothetical protein CRYUN_Cryun25bG0007700 [Craigia yunnanensis]